MKNTQYLKKGDICNLANVIESNTYTNLQDGERFAFCHIDEEDIAYVIFRFTKDQGFNEEIEILEVLDWTQYKRILEDMQSKAFYEIENVYTNSNIREITAICTKISNENLGFLSFVYTQEGRPGKFEARGAVLEPTEFLAHLNGHNSFERGDIFIDQVTGHRYASVWSPYGSNFIELK